MTGKTRQRGASCLAAIAFAGLALSPLLHAEQHLREERARREAALAVVFQLGFLRGRTQAQERQLRQALEEAFSGTGHEHGPSGRSRGHEHGMGALQHLALAVHGAPPPPAALAPPRSVQHGIRQPVLPVFSASYTTPERSQAPPSA